MVKRRLKKGPKIVLITLLILCFLCASFFAIRYYIILNKEIMPMEYHDSFYSARDFGINIIKSSNDFDSDGIDDYSDILLGAQKERDINPIYVSDYYDGGYPPDNEGVCTDTIWRALKEAGYDLKGMIATDIRSDQTSSGMRYNIDIRDDNIDFRRVYNQEVFLKEYVESFSTDMYDIEEFMPGDIIVFNDSEHIAIVSDKRNANGIPYLIQNRDVKQIEKEEDRLEITEMIITGHYRFTYSRELQHLINKI